jgi:hypothetical protein
LLQQALKITDRNFTSVIYDAFFQQKIKICSTVLVAEQFGKINKNLKRQLGFITWSDVAPPQLSEAEFLFTHKTFFSCTESVHFFFSLSLSNNENANLEMFQLSFAVCM